MIKKIIMWTIYAGIVGLLVFGAVNRTSAKTDQGVLFGKPAAEAETAQGRGGTSSSVQTNDFNDADHAENPEEHDWVELGGIITEFDSRSLIILTEGAGELELAGRAGRFILETGYLPSVGQQVWLSGFYESGEFKIANFQDLKTGQIVLVRDNSGQPLWR